MLLNSASCLESSICTKQQRQHTSNCIRNIHNFGVFINSGFWWVGILMNSRFWWNQDFCEVVIFVNSGFWWNWDFWWSRNFDKFRILAVLGFCGVGILLKSEFCQSRDCGEVRILSKSGFWWSRNFGKVRILSKSGFV